jgi:hypothetical protein
MQIWWDILYIMAKIFRDLNTCLPIKNFAWKTCGELTSVDSDGSLLLNL